MNWKRIIPFGRKNDDFDAVEKKLKKQKKAEVHEDELTVDAKNTKAIQLVKMVSFLTLFLVFSNFRMIKDIQENNRTIIQYGASSAEYWVSGSDTGEDYARSMAVFFMTMWGNVTSASAKAQFSEILKYAHPLYFAPLKERLTARQKLLEKYRTLSFYARLTPNDVMTKTSMVAHPYTMIKTPVYRVTYTIQQRRLLGQTPTPEKAVMMTFDYTVDNGKASLLDIFEANTGKN